jgi:hypothetical protein
MEPPSSLDSAGGSGFPGIILSSFAHSPKSISRQRSEQKGLKWFVSLQLTSMSQVGQLTIRFLSITLLLA